MFRRLISLLFRTSVKVFTPIESRIVSEHDAPIFAPIFIVGPARSGTTLIYQSIVYSLNVCYLSNLMVAFPNCPALVAKYTSYINDCKTQKIFSSHYGKIKGWCSPSQGHQVWSRWFPKEGEGTKSINWTDCEKKQLVGTISFIESVYNAPFINKWPGFSVNISKLIEAIPQAVFIRVKRDPLQTAQSILKGRRDLTGDPYTSISRVPKNYKYYASKSYIDQVCAYLQGVEAQIDQESSQIGEDKFLSIRYENFCLAPQKNLEKIIDWYREVGNYKLNIQHMDLPIFEISNSQKVSNEELYALRECLSSWKERLI
jgi:hypothetical protein